MNESTETKFVPAWWDVAGMKLTLDKRPLAIGPGVLMQCAWLKVWFS
jgi:hypothetical protein